MIAAGELIVIEVDTSAWRRPPVFDWLQEVGNIETDEMRRTFNCGVGMIVAVAEADFDKTVGILTDSGESAWRIGRVTDAHDGVAFI